MSGIDAGPAWSAWSQVTPVVVGPAARAPYVRVELPLSIAPDPDGAYPDLRVTDANGNERPYALDAAVVGAGAGKNAPASLPLERVAVESRERDDPVEHAQVWRFAAPIPMRVAAVTFSDGGARYQRSVTVETSDDDAIWSWKGDGTIARYPDGRSQTLISIAEATARFIRVTVQEGDDVPIPALEPALLVRRHMVVFPAGGAPRLLSGNPYIGAPSDGLAEQLARERWTADDATTGPTVANAGYRDPRPAGERLPWPIIGALIAAAFALGAGALRTLRSVPAR